MTESPSAAAQRLLVQAADAVMTVARSGSDAELVAVLTTCEQWCGGWTGSRWMRWPGWSGAGCSPSAATRSPAAALAICWGGSGSRPAAGWSAAEQVTPRAGLDGAVLPARLPATAEVFAAGRAGLRHVEVIARVLGTAPARG